MERANIQGFSVIEMLVVISVFTILAVVSTQAVFLTLRSSGKSQAISQVKSELDNATLLMERQLYNATSIENCSLSPVSVNFRDYLGKASVFSCINDAGLVRIASGSASTWITSRNINITGCTFTCNIGSKTVPDSVDIFLRGENVNFTGVQGYSVEVQTKILLKSY